MGLDKIQNHKIKIHRIVSFHFENHLISACESTFPCRQEKQRIIYTPNDKTVYKLPINNAGAPGNSAIVYPQFNIVPGKCAMIR